MLKTQIHPVLKSKYNPIFIFYHGHYILDREVIVLFLFDYSNNWSKLMDGLKRILYLYIDVTFDKVYGKKPVIPNKAIRMTSPSSKPNFLSEALNTIGILMKAR